MSNKTEVMDIKKDQAWRDSASVYTLQLIIYFQNINAIAQYDYNYWCWRDHILL